MESKLTDLFKGALDYSINTRCQSIAVLLVHGELGSILVSLRA